MGKDRAPGLGIASVCSLETTQSLTTHNTSTTHQQQHIHNNTPPPPPPTTTHTNREAVHALLDADVSGAPVVDADGRLVGVLSEKDVIWKGAGAPDDHFIIPPVFVGALEATLFLRDNAAFEAEAKKILARTVR